MDKKKRNIVFVLLALFFSVIAEKAIPHTHTEIEGAVLPDWDSNSKEPHEDYDSETLHNSFYQPSIFNYSHEQIVITQLVFIVFTQEYIEKSIKVPDYNILPKILNSILFIVHTYSSKAPPLYS